MMSGDTPKPSLDCPGCGSEVFIRDTTAWFTDEDEHCAGCGSRVMVALDEDSADPDLLTARVYVYEHGGDVVARLRAEAGERLSTIAGLEVELEQSTQAEADDAATIERIRAEGLELDAQLRVETRVRVSAQAEAERLTANSDDLRTEADSLGDLYKGAVRRIERLTRERDAAKSTADIRLGAGLEASRSAIAYRERAETAERAASVAQREVCERRARDHSPRFGGNAAVAKRARAIAKTEGWDCYPEDTTDETGGDQ